MLLFPTSLSSGVEYIMQQGGAIWMTTFARAWPLETYRTASAASSSPVYVRSMAGVIFPASMRSPRIEESERSANSSVRY